MKPIISIAGVLSLAVAAMTSAAADHYAFAWPSDFDSKVAALVENAAPSGDALASGTLASAFDSFAFSSLPSPSYGSEESAFVSRWKAVFFSDATRITGIPVGLMLWIR